MNISILARDFAGAILAVAMVVLAAFVALEPAIASAVEDQVVVTQEVTAGITISSPSDTSMSRALTVTDSTSIGTTTWTVTTNSQSGYTMSLTASSTAGCDSESAQDSDTVPDTLCDVGNGEAFNDLATTSKATWSVTNDYQFGYSAVGNDVTGHGTGSSCGETHTPSTTLTYQGLDGTNTSYQVASSTSETGTTGTGTDVCWAVEQQGVFAPSGSYQATTTATAVVQ